jgi:hypothetical protein
MGAASSADVDKPAAAPAGDAPSAAGSVAAGAVGAAPLPALAHGRGASRRAAVAECRGLAPLLLLLLQLLAVDSPYLLVLPRISGTRREGVTTLGLLALLPLVPLPPQPTGVPLLLQLLLHRDATQRPGRSCRL